MANARAGSAFASEQRVHRILADAGFQSVTLEPRDFDLDIACGGGIEEALESAMALGPTSRALQDQGGNACRGCHVDPPRAATLSTRQAGCACRGNLARHREQRLARGAEVSLRAGLAKARAFAFIHRSKNSSSFLGKNPEWAGRDRSPQSRRRCGMVEVHLNRYGARCRPEGTRCFPSWHRCASSGGARGTD